MLFDDDDVDNVDTLTDDDRAAYDAEARGEVYESSPEPSPEMVDEKEQLSRQLAEAQERAARLDERRLAAEEANAPSRQPEPSGPPSRLGPRPDDYIDPIGADLWDVRRENEILAHRFEQQQVERQRQEFANWVNNDAATFRAQHPDYDTATKHAYEWRVKHWMARAGVPEANARAIVDQEAVATAMFARQNGKSAAAAFYEVGKSLASAPARQQQPVRQRQPVPTRGKAGTRRVTAHDINAMGESEFEAALRSNPKAVTKALESLEFER